MSRRQGRHGLAFDDDITLAKEVDTIFRIHWAPLVMRVKCLFSLKRDAPVGQFNCKRLLVAVFVDTRTKLIVNRMQCAHNIIDMILQLFDIHHGISSYDGAIIPKIYRL